jgi:hypothetical protein
MPPVTPVPDIDAFEERAAIMQYDGGLSRSDGREQGSSGSGVPGC